MLFTARGFTVPANFISIGVTSSKEMGATGRQVASTPILVTFYWKQKKVAMALKPRTKLKTIYNMNNLVRK